jgi:hypothetical protein
MAFNFQAYRNPYVSTIAELLSRGEDAKAKALVDVANAQARAAEARGQAYGGAIENVGKIASKALTDYTTAKQNAPIRAAEAELRQQALETGRDARLLQKGQAFLSSAMADAPDPNYERDAATGMSRYAGPPSPTYPGLYKTGPLGSKLLDPTAARQLLVDNGFAGNVEALMPIVNNQNARTSAMVASKLKARGEYAEDALQMMQAGSPWEQAVGFAGHSGVENGLFSEKELSDLTASGVNLPPEQQKAILLNVMKQGGAQTTFEGPGQNQFLNGIATGGNTGAKPLTDAEQLSAAYAATSPTPAQQALMEGDARRATNTRAPVADRVVTVAGPDGRPMQVTKTPEEMRAGVKIYDKPVSVDSALLNETRELRNQILRQQSAGLATTANEKQTLKDLNKRIAEQSSQDTIDSIGKLAVIDPKTGDVTGLLPGTKSLFGLRIPGIRLIPGEAATAGAYLDQLNSRGIIDLIGEMKSQSRTGGTGFGSLAVKELAVLERANSILSQPNISDAAALAAMRDIYNVARKYTKTATTSSNPAPKKFEIDMDPSSPNFGRPVIN